MFLRWMIVLTLVGCKTSSPNSMVRDQSDAVGRIAWLDTIVRKHQIGSVFELKLAAKSVGSSERLFAAGRCTILDRNESADEIPAGTKFQLLGQMSGFRSGDLLTGNWLILKRVGSRFDKQVGLGCIANNSQDMRIASSYADPSQLEDAFTISPPRSNVSKQFKSEWTPALLGIELGKVMKFVVDGKPESNANGPGFIFTSKSAVCTGYPIIFGKPQTLSKIEAGSDAVFVGQIDMAPISGDSALVGVRMVLQVGQGYLALGCSDLTSKNNVIPASDIPAAVIGSIVE